FFGMAEPEATPGPARAAVDAVAAGHAVDVGPARFHRLFGAIPIRPGHELRVTGQGLRVMPNATTSPARIVIREWYRSGDGIWRLNPHRNGIAVNASKVAAFARIVAEAARHLAGEAKS